MERSDDVVWVVQFGNYEPSEVISIHKTKSGAEQKLKELCDRMIEIVEWQLED